MPNQEEEVTVYCRCDSYFPYGLSAEKGGPITCNRCGLPLPMYFGKLSYIEVAVGDPDASQSTMLWVQFRDPAWGTYVQVKKGASPEQVSIALETIAAQILQMGKSNKVVDQAIREASR